MNHVLWAAKPLCLADHRMLWWMLAHQQVVRGVGTGYMAKGWRTLAVRDLNVNPRWARECVARLRNAGLITYERSARDARICGEVFQLSAQQSEIEREAEAEAAA